MTTTITITEHECTILQAVPMLEALTDGGDAVMLWGPPGVGKTSIVNQLGKRRGRKVIEFRTNIREPVDVRGIPVPDLKTGTTRWLVPNELPQVERDGEFGYLFIDEINTGSIQMMAVMMGLVLERKVGDYVLPPGWRIIAAGNRVADRAAAQRMPTALRNRFAHIYIIPDVNSWCVWANANGVAPEAVAFIRLKQTIYQKPEGDQNAFLTARSFTASAKYVNADSKIRMRLFATHIGDAWAGEFDGFVMLYRSLGSLDDIVANPDDAKVPTELSERYAVSVGLGRIATKKNFPNIIRYAKRLNRESEILVVTDAAGRDVSLKNTPCYGAWAVANADVIVQ